LDVSAIASDSVMWRAIAYKKALFHLPGIRASSDYSPENGEELPTRHLKFFGMA
jgi:hypothetical protein